MGTGICIVQVKKRRDRWSKGLPLAHPGLNLDCNEEFCILLITLDFIPYLPWKILEHLAQEGGTETY